MEQHDIRNKSLSIIAPQVKHYLTVRYGNVRKKSLLFVDTLKANGYECLPLEIAKDIFSDITGVYDQKSLKAYFGTKIGKSTRDMVKTARYSTGTTSFKAIRLTVNVPERKGYLEKLNLVAYEKRGSVWFLLINESSILPTLSLREFMKDSQVPSNNSLSPTYSHSFEKGFGKKAFAPTANNTETIEREEREL
jgi:hypothetical protein